MEVANDKFQGMQLNVGKKEEEEVYMKKIIELCPFIHDSTKRMCKKFLTNTKREVHVTPKSFLDLIENYKYFFGQVKKVFDANIKK